MNAAPGEIAERGVLHASYLRTVMEIDARPIVRVARIASSSAWLVLGGLEPTSLGSGRGRISPGCSWYR